MGGARQRLRLSAAYQERPHSRGLDTHSVRRPRKIVAVAAALCRRSGVEFRLIIRGAADHGQVSASAIRRLGLGMDHLHAVLPGGPAPGISLLFLPRRDISAGRAQALVAPWLLAVSIAALPLRPPRPIATGGSPAAAILLLLASSVGLPYFALSATGPLLQSWLAGSRGRHFPYRLFALSNAASLLALLAYPVAIEPFLSTRLQMTTGRAAIFSCWSCLAAGRGRQSDANTSGRRRRGQSSPNIAPWPWIALAACASTLWLAMANYLGQQVAPFRSSGSSR